MRQQNADTGTIYHVRRNPRADPDRYYYDERDHNATSPALYGRSVVARLSAGEARGYRESIRDYARDENNLPRLSRRENCQTFVGGALGHLKRGGLLRPGHSQYYSQFYGQPSPEIGRRIREDGRHFWQAPRVGPAATVVAEHREPRGRGDRSARGGLLAERYRNLR
ncbi:hypothetical protein F5Y17DRAFT_453213 [Xylariaceae sp. FL0594]|nr:hypothetical protein F5Y17DRAFT_453213 [Xylariaceae sp. FL0594]